MIADLRSGDVDLQREAMLNLKAIVENGDEFLKDLLSADLLPSLANAMQGELHDSILMMLAKISAKSRDCAKAVYDIELFPKITEAIRSDDEELSTTCIRSVGYITQICFPWDAEMKVDMMGQLAKLLEGELSFEMVESLAEAFLCISRRNRDDPLLSDDVALDLLKTLKVLFANVVRHENPKSRGLVDTLLAMSYISEQGRSKTRMFVELGFSHILATLFPYNDSSVRLYTLRVIADICYGGIEEVDAFLDVGVLSFVRSSLSVESSSRFASRMKLEVVRMLAYVLGGTLLQIQKVIEYELFCPMKELLMKGNCEIQEMTVFAFMNATRKQEAAQYMLTLDCIPLLCEVLNSKSCSSETATDIITALLNFIYFANNEHQFAEIIKIIECHALESIDECRNSTDTFLVIRAGELYDTVVGDESRTDRCSITSDNEGKQFTF